MDDVFGILPSWMFTAIVAVIVLLIIGIILLASIAAHLRNRHLSVPGLAGKKW
ncbi:Inner membrane protein YqiK [Salmonella enterica subsp. enterica serovar Paratyphi C]|nr:Inner membrane protein YqiK [Salmonella enterica subsp. enterica serovar Paratyphi C]